MGVFFVFVFMIFFFFILSRTSFVRDITSIPIDGTRRQNAEAAHRRVAKFWSLVNVVTNFGFLFLR